MAHLKSNKAGHTANPVACWWAGAFFEVTLSFGQEQWGLESRSTRLKSGMNGENELIGKKRMNLCRRMINDIMTSGTISKEERKKGREEAMNLKLKI